MNTYKHRDLSPALKNAWRYFQTLVGANPVYTDLYFQAEVAASEFLTYNAKKLYFAYEFKGYAHNPLNSGYIEFYNAANVVNYVIMNAPPFYDTSVPAVRFYLGNCEVQNIFFSRLVCGTYSTIVFNGIKVTWP
jgi:hypothetical protein